MKRIFFPVFLLSVVFVASIAHSQAPAYGGPLLYSIPIDTSVPPLYSGQPSAVTAAYLWFDEALRASSAGIDNYIEPLIWNDTEKTIAGYLYQIQDDNPVSYYNWTGYGIHPYPYKGSPSTAEFAFEKRVWQLKGANIGALLFSEIIADVTISDTICVKQVSSSMTTDQVLVNSTIIDEIKGKRVLQCPIDLRTRKKSSGSTSGASAAITALVDTASTGTCLQFQYSPEWPIDASNDESPTIGWWVKPATEYIVFLSFNGIGHDSTSYYFSTWPVSFGHCAGMYPVIDGIVQDPNDDLKLGGANLTITAWKAALRAKISALITP